MYIYIHTYLCIHISQRISYNRYIYTQLSMMCILHIIVVHVYRHTEKCITTYIHTYIHTYMRAYIHTYMHIHAHACICVYIYVKMYTFIHRTVCLCVHLPPVYLPIHIICLSIYAPIYLSIYIYISRFTDKFVPIGLSIAGQLHIARWYIVCQTDACTRMHTCI